MAKIKSNNYASWRDITKTKNNNNVSNDKKIKIVSLNATAQHIPGGALHDVYNIIFIHKINMEIYKLCNQL